MVAKIFLYLSDLLAGKKKIKVWLCLLVFSLVVSILPAYRLVTKGYPLIKKIPTLANEVVDEVYPNDLTLTVKNGKVSSNVPEPYFITMKVSRLKEIEEMYSPEDASRLPKISKIRLLTIDTNASIEDYYKYQTVYLLTREYLVYQSSGDIKFRSLSSISDTTITKDWIKGELSRLETNKFVSFLIKYGLFLLIPLIPVGVLLSLLLSISIPSLVIYLMSRLMRTGIGYRKIFVWSLIVNLPVEFLSRIGSEFGRIGIFVVEIISNITSILILSLAYYIFRKYRGKKDEK